MIVFDFIFEAWKDGIHFGGFELCLAVILTVAYAMGILLIWLALQFIWDNTFNRVSEWTPTKLIVNKVVHNSSHTTWIMSGKTMIPIYHPQNWDYYGEFKTDKGIKNGSLNSEEKLSEKSLDIIYGYHKISGALDIDWA